MKHHERDYFVSRIRSGIHYLTLKGERLKILTPTLDELAYANEIYSDTYVGSQHDGIKNMEEMHKWMIESGLWTKEDDEKEQGLTEDIERLKIEIFKHRNKESERETIRKYIRAAEKQSNIHNAHRLRFYDNTSEGVSFLAKHLHLIRKTTFSGPYLYHFDDVSAKDVWMTYQSNLCVESVVRELARSEPWATLWSMREIHGVKLFNNQDGRELSLEQKNILTWSMMYDNISEAHEMPSRDVVDDNDMLDGWLILQAQKREQEKAQSELEHTMNDKVRDSDEIFMVADSKKDANRINNMNTLGSKMVKKERETHIKSAGKLDQHQLPDQKIHIQNQVHQQYKDKFRR